MVKIFYEAQMEAILSGTEKISEKLLYRIAMQYRNAADNDIYEGTSVSDFTFEEQEPEAKEEAEIEYELYRKRRGRPVEKRHENDLIIIRKEASDPKSELMKRGLLEEVELCYLTL
jgi:hypothetical protein